MENFVTDVEQLKPLGVRTAWNESKSMQPSRCADESGHRDTRGWSPQQLEVHFGGSPRRRRRKVAGKLLDPPGAPLPGGPQMLGSSSMACELDHGKCDECTSSSVHRLRLCQASMFSVKPSKAPVIFVSPNTSCQGKSNPSSVCPEWNPFSSTQQSSLVPTLHLSVLLARALSEVIHLFENTNLSKNQSSHWSPDHRVPPSNPVPACTRTRA